MLRTMIALSTLMFLPALTLVAACSEMDMEDIASTPGAAGDANSDKAAVEQTVRSAVDTYNRQDAAGFVSLWTDDGLQEEFGVTMQEIISAPEAMFGGPPRTLRSLSKTDISGDKASTEAEIAIGLGLAREKLELVKQAGAWKLNGSEILPVNIPSGAASIDVDLDESSFKFDEKKLGANKVAFKAENLGDQAHEIVILKTPEGFDVTHLLQSVTLPTGVQVIAGFGPLESGAKGTLVLAEPLPSGHYTMVCFLPDETEIEGIPHAFKGMVKDFNVGGQGGNR